LTYLISDGSTKNSDFTALLRLTRAAVEAGVSYIQLREKHLSVRVLLDLATQLAGITKNSQTKLLINDRADVALAAGADGVHLPSNGLPPAMLRRELGVALLIAVSTHSVEDVIRAREAGADLVVFGPVFATPSKMEFGTPVGLEMLREAASAAGTIPLLALGGIGRDNFSVCLDAGAAGIAGIRIFGDPGALRENFAAIVGYH
jgi:thiamine-phosphate pyrophosphorylase